MTASDNRYSAPTAKVDDIDDAAGVQPIRFFSPRGRIGRLRLLAYNMGGGLIFQLPALLFGFMSAISPLLGFALLAAMVIPYAYFVIVITIQRSHDMNWSGWTVLACLIPFVALIWVFMPGTRGNNRFGAPPPSNTLGVKILALFLPVIFVIGIVAAVALPAYQQYTMRAKAVQQMQQQVKP